MELTYITIIVLACMIFVLSGMVGYLYWQQTRILQQVQSLSVIIATQFTQAEPEPIAEPEAIQQTVAPETEQEVEVEEMEDDRVSVEHVEGPVTVEEVTSESESDTDVDDLQDKTAAQLRELLTKNGIPFGKRDSKAVLLQLLKATA